MKDESHDSKLVKEEEIEDIVKPTLRDGTETRPHPGNSIYPFVSELDWNPTYVDSKIADSSLNSVAAAAEHNPAERHENL